MLETLGMPRVLRVDQARCAHETIDDETMVVDTVSGRLIRIAGIGPTVWDRLVAGSARDGLMDEVADRYGPDAAGRTGRFLDALIDAELVAEVDGPAARSSDEAASWPDAFVEPELEHFDDIADIMTMDPVHEVDLDRGWPHAAVPGDAGG